MRPKILQDKIIFKIFSRFAYNYGKLKYTKNIAVAVSGGASAPAEGADTEEKSEFSVIITASVGSKHAVV